MIRKCIINLGSKNLRTILFNQNCFTFCDKKKPPSDQFKNFARKKDKKIISHTIKQETTKKNQTKFQQNQKQQQSKMNLVENEKQTQSKNQQKQKEPSLKIKQFDKTGGRPGSKSKKKLNITKNQKDQSHNQKKNQQNKEPEKQDEQKNEEEINQLKKEAKNDFSTGFENFIKKGKIKDKRSKSIHKSQKKSTNKQQQKQQTTQNRQKQQKQQKPFNKQSSNNQQNKKKQRRLENQLFNARMNKMRKNQLFQQIAKLLNPILLIEYNLAKIQKMKILFEDFNVQKQVHQNLFRQKLQMLKQINQLVIKYKNIKRLYLYKHLTTVFNPAIIKLELTFQMMQMKKNYFNLLVQSSKMKVQLQKKYEALKQQAKILHFQPLYFLAGLGLLVGLYLLSQKKKQLSFQQFKNELDNQRLQNIKIVDIHSLNQNYKIVQFKVNGQEGFISQKNIQEIISNLQKRKNIKVTYDVRISIFSKIHEFNKILEIGIMSLIFIGVVRMLYVLKKTSNPTSMFKNQWNKKKFQVVKDVKVKFNDVAGLKQSKFQIQEFVDFLKYPDKYQHLGARIPKGALLSGPPGTGKTMLAKACAGQAGVPFFFTSGSDFVQMYVGVGASRIRDLFKLAKESAPSIIFIDQIDAIGKKRGNDLGSNDERDGTLNQLLVQMDGFGTHSKVIVLAATNRKQLLDGALTRPGRFDRIIQITLPDLQQRKQIFSVHLKNLKLSNEKSKQEYERRLATLSPGFSGAEIANLCNQAAILAARKQKQFIQTIDFQMAAQRVIGGIQRKSLMSQQQRKVVAIHQSGHAVISWFLEGAYPLLKVTIIPRSKGSLGFAQYLPNQNRLETTQELIDRICFILGGRCAQQYFNNKITTGAYDDLQKAYQIAHSLVTKYGMSKKLGFIGYKDNQFLKPYSSKTLKLIDQQIKQIIDNCTIITKNMIKKHQAHIKNLSEALLKHESLDGKQIRQILGQRPFPPQQNYRAYLQMQKQDQIKKQKIIEKI